MKRRLQDWLSSYLRYSQFSEAPETFHFWTGVSVIAGALRRRVWIDQFYFQWTPNFYIVFVAPSGIISKSTTMNIGIRLLRQLQDITFGPEAVTWQALITCLSNAAREELDPSTGEMLPMSCVTIASGEFGTLLDPQDRSLVDVMTALWDGQIGVFDKVTKANGSEHVVNPWINLIAATTPDWIAGYFPEYFIGGGFTSRCIFVYGDRKRHYCAYPIRQMGTNTSEHRKLHDDLVHDLEIISSLIGEYKLSPEAEQWGEQWYADHFKKEKNPDMADARFGGYYARKQTHIHKIAMVLAASHSDNLIISLKVLQRAVALMDEVEKQMPKVYGLIGRSLRAKTEEVVANTIVRRKSMFRNDLYLHLHSRLSVQEIDIGIKAALAAGLIRQGTVGGRAILTAAPERGIDPELAPPQELRKLFPP